MSESLFQDEGAGGVDLLDRYVRVVVERGIDSVGGGRGGGRGGGKGGEYDAGMGLTYRLRVGDESVQIGERVRVPLGRGDRLTGGIVVETGSREMLGNLPQSKVKAIAGTTGVRLPERLIELGRWMADYYVCPFGMVLAGMLPSAVKKSIGRKRRIEIDFVDGADADEVEMPKATAQAWAALLAKPEVLPDRAKDVAHKLGLSSTAALGRLVRLGLLHEVERTVFVSPPMPWEGLRTEAQGMVDDVVPTRAQRDVIEGICAGLGTFSSHLIRGVTGSGKTEVYLRVMERVLGGDDTPTGRTALMLVPEIGLTPQTAGRLQRRFGSDRVAVLHSGLTASQRNRQWMHASSGECRVVIGARSAIFAPLPNLGLIIVDEEHGTDYKQDQLPRYNARDVAVKRAQIEGCPVVMGSATPSLESWSNARAGRYRLWTLNERVGGGTLPRVEVVDMMREGQLQIQIEADARGRARARAQEEAQEQNQTQDQAQKQKQKQDQDQGRQRERVQVQVQEQGHANRAKGGNRPRQLRAIGPTLEAALRQTLDTGGQAILLLNRRGYANVLACPSSRCAWVLQCDDCDVTMVLHRHRGLPVGEVLRCHHCLAQRLVPRVCPVCGLALVAIGVGTQRLEQELTSTFDELRAVGALLRIDGDTMRSARDYFSALSRFASGEVRVLMGTQIVSKGLDFPNVRLVGVVNADTGLWMPDFRASERTFQLVSQVAGRTGRGGPGAARGRVIVQTLNPDQPAIRHAAMHAYETFADEELAIRARSGLPPSTRMARIVVRDKDRQAAMTRAADLADRLKAAGRDETGRTSGLRVIGPMPAPIERVAGQHRIVIELFAPTATALLEPLRRLRAVGLVKSDAQTAVDVDPIWLM